MIESRPRSGFARGNRLLTAAEFSAVLANRRVLRGEHFDLLFRRAETDGQGSARLGLIVGKRLARRAVLRNLLKRIGREAFRPARPELPDCDVVLRLARPLPPADRSLRRALRAEIDRLLQRLGGELSR